MLTKKQEQFFKDYSRVLMHKKGHKVMKVEAINEIILSSKYFFGDYGVDQFLEHFKGQFETIHTYLKLQQELEITTEQQQNIKPRMKI